MKFIFTFLLLFISVFSFTQTTVFNINGHTFHQSGTAKLLIFSLSNQSVSFDSTSIKNGSFSFTDTLDEPKLFRLQIENETRDLFLGNEQVVITQKDSLTKEILVAGSSLTNDYDQFVKKHKSGLVSASQNNKSLPDSAALFVRKHPASFVSLYVLNEYVSSYSIIQLNALYKMLNTALKQYPAANKLTEKINYGLHLSATCPPFSVRDNSHQIVDLQSFKGQYLLINFWASWCVPCMRNLPSIQKAATQFQHNSFTILMVSLDIDTSNWKTAVQKYHLTEMSRNVFLENGFKNEMAQRFAVSFIPANVLVDPAGNIIDRNLEGEALLQKLQTIFTPASTGEKAKSAF